MKIIFSLTNLFISFDEKLFLSDKLMCFLWWKTFFLW